MLVSGKKRVENDLFTFQMDLKNLFDKWKSVSPMPAENIFPIDILNSLREIGALDALLSHEEGGLNFCRSLEGGLALLNLLRRTGYLNLSLGRCLEGHVNVVRLVELYGTLEQRHILAQQLRSEILAGIWVTDGVPPVTIKQENTQYRLAGIKGFASGVMQVGLALITATTQQGHSIMVLAPTVEVNRRRSGPGKLMGMQASGTGAYDFTDIVISSDNIIGSAGDYLRQPEFSAGAWRGSAVTLGAMDRLIDLLRQELVDRGRAHNPHQLHRLGEALILQKTASMWVMEAAKAAYTPGMQSEDVVATVNLARIAVERAALELITLVQRSLGLSAFVKGKAVEQVMRDLMTYLRQPAPDEALTEAAAWFANHDWPGENA
ncbi:acyl-CoA dehydrogenase [Acetobacter pasteurianus NBRC 3280]|uniref:Acyl-CoA dehydrogenase n=1 Tax=Acetobacter pasteurianus NBRC 3278 TaxID=1226660 RepID=A0A401X3H2_ACEPA|nr:acyl-CoA dehydrogenase [Acetobacter pasteurianus]GCD58877.1 acyl-CoA dehydrogenase [Acetobacter pasteurianus NBRC 3277]GCD62370.1 acyl-CoA dehydrogenase [Acetobacter pasteurianus NBRC 3278]GCD68742.1 acyl-CoA dehydrogenase [Acetobacter pasteurianus NBRC 3280]